MEVTLTPEVEHRLELRLREGRWHSASEVLETALDILDDLEDVIVLSREELDSKIEESMAAVERGETFSEEEAKAHIAKVRASL